MNEATDTLGAPSALRRLRRALGRVYRDLGPFEDTCRAALRALAFLAWTVLVRLGLRRKARLVMHCAGDGEVDGFYAQFTVVLGLLAHVEKWQAAIEGARIDLQDQGLYYDPAHGRNSWEYYFLPIDTGRDSGAIEREIDLRQQYRFAVRGERMARERAGELIARHIRVRPHILAKIDAFTNAHFRGARVIGVHFRGTDKWTEAPRVSYAEVCAAVRVAIGEEDADGYRVFVASDEQAFVETMETAFPGKVVSWETRRSVDGTPIDFIMKDNYKKGEDALIDCLLLSRCDRLIRTASSLSLCATYFNPQIPVVVLNRHHVESQSEAFRDAW